MNYPLHEYSKFVLVVFINILYDNIHEETQTIDECQRTEQLREELHLNSHAARKFIICIGFIHDALACMGQTEFEKFVNDLSLIYDQELKFNYDLFDILVKKDHQKIYEITRKIVKKYREREDLIHKD